MSLLQTWYIVTVVTIQHIGQTDLGGAEFGLLQICYMAVPDVVSKLQNFGQTHLGGAEFGCHIMVTYMLQIVVCNKPVLLRNSFTLLT